MQRQRWNKWSFIVLHTKGARRPSAVLTSFFAASIGSHCWGQAWKKGLLGSGLLSRQPSARSMRNTSLGCAQLRKLLGQRGVPTVIPKPIQNLPQKLQILCGRRSGMFEPLERFGSSIRIEDESANCGKIFTTALTWRCEHTNKKGFMRGEY